MGLKKRCVAGRRKAGEEMRDNMVRCTGRGLVFRKFKTA